MMKLSIIVPLYNTEEFIQECLTSILQQSFTNYELIIVDDGSTDNSISIVESYMENDNRIKLFKQKNSGASVARNYGIKQSCGEYVTFIDSDDFIHEDALLNLVTTAEQTNSDIVLGKRQFNVDNKPTDDSRLRKLFKEKIITTNVAESPEVRKVIAIHGKIFKRSFLIENKLTFPEGMSSEDFIFTYLSYAHSDNISVIPNLVYSYRVRANDNKSITQDRLSEYNIKCRFKQMTMTEDICRKFASLNISYEQELKLNYNSRLPRHIEAINHVTQESVLAFDLIKNNIKDNYEKIYSCVNENNKIRYHLIKNNKIKELTIFNRAVSRKNGSVINILKLCIALKSYTIAKKLLKKKVIL
ncbi:glycosyltransferase [Vibrio sp. Isolate34]|uniref:glycosyltransferase family 2 protein n=2 Tax=unclassified Vibrio TaxID=2614977 RepID=UPI001EFC6326|nr:glycosyltransferase [Vibrio sp. Isolate34]MCG9639542.1 glycosyltransferase [Vibrio sp. Isolate34]